MLQRSAAILAAASLALSAAASAGAQGRDRPPGEGRQRPGYEGRRPDAAQGAETGSVRGRVTDLRTATLRGEGERHVLGRLHLERGATLIVDLGPVQEFRRLAQRAKSAPGKESAGAGEFPLAVTGRIVDERTTATIRGLPGPRLLVKLQADTGRRYVVELGRADRLSLRLQEGERIAVFGMPGRLNNRPIIVAGEVAELVTVSRREEARTGVIAKRRGRPPDGQTAQQPRGRN